MFGTLLSNEIYCHRLGTQEQLESAIQRSEALLKKMEGKRLKVSEFALE